MRRRTFIVGLGSAAAWPIVARAQQQPPLLVGGVLNFVSIEAYADRIARFRQGLKDTGLVEGQGLLLEYRSADGHEERLPALAADLVGKRSPRSLSWVVMRRRPPPRQLPPQFRSYSRPGAILLPTAWSRASADPRQT